MYLLLCPELDIFQRHCGAYENTFPVHGYCQPSTVGQILNRMINKLFRTFQYLQDRCLAFLRAHCTNGLHRLKIHILGHLVDGLSRFENFFILSASLYEHSRVNLKIPYSSTCKRRQTRGTDSIEHRISSLIPQNYFNVLDPQIFPFEPLHQLGSSITVFYTFSWVALV